MIRCSARGKQSGNPCRQPVVPGRQVCYYHGGASPRGLASPHWKHGRDSRALGALMRVHHRLGGTP
jgi:hypothetical protein